MAAIFNQFFGKYEGAPFNLVKKYDDGVSLIIIYVLNAVVVVTYKRLTNVFNAIVVNCERQFSVLNTFVVVNCERLFNVFDVVVD